MSETLPDLYSLAFIPGQFRCPECGFQLSKQTISVPTGHIGLTDKDLNSEPCPNDGTMMEHVTYKEQVEGYAERLKEELQKNDSAPPIMSLQEARRRTHAEQISIEAILEWMRYNGSSIILNWGEDDGMWECSWITGGIRFTGYDTRIRLAITAVLVKCFQIMIEDKELEMPS